MEADESMTEGLVAGYAPPGERPPLGSYAATSTLFNLGLAGALANAQRSGRIPERVEGRDLVIIGVASHKLSRLISKEKITAFVRAPFTELEAKGGPAELEERARGTGTRRTVGELLTCPFCLGLWSSAGFHVGLLYAPRVTRVGASIFASLTISDFLQIAYKAAETHGIGDSD
jgi:hypothetical protein